MAKDRKDSGMSSIANRISAYAVPVDNIVFQEGFLQRDEINPEKVQEIKQQIIEHIITTKNQHPKPYGIHTPITGFYMDGKFQLNHGHHRLSAVRELKNDGTLDRLVAEGKIDVDDVERIINIPATRVAPPIGKTEEETKRAEALLYLRQIVDNSGQNYKPLECARICQLVETKYDMSQAEIANFLGKSVSQISSWLKLMDMPTEIQETISDGSVAASYANELVREVGLEKATQYLLSAVEKAKKEGKKKVTKKDVEEEIGKAKPTKKEIRNLLLTMERQDMDGGVSQIPTEALEKLLAYVDVV